MIDLPGIARMVREQPGLRAKGILAAVARTLGGDGDDAAVVGDGIVVAAEAIAPALVAESPRVAGIAGVVTVLNDLAATGARPLAILDTVVAGEGPLVAEVLAGLASAAALYGVPIVGGHTTLAAGAEGLSTFGVGRATHPLRARRARAGDPLLLVACLEGEAAVAGGIPIFSHLRGPRRDRAGRDLALLAEAAEAGEAWACRDVSMPGVAGSLLQFLESAGHLGCALDLDALPAPEGMGVEGWLAAFPSYAFLLAGDPDALQRRFGAAGLTCARVGTLDSSGCLRIAAGSREEPVWDLAREPLTGLRPG